MINIFIKNSTKHDYIDGDMVYLRRPQKSDYPMWHDVRLKSQNFLKPWEPLWPENVLSYKHFKSYLNAVKLEAKQKRGYAFFIFRKSDNQLVGGITLTNIRYGVVKSAQIGYWSGVDYAGGGFMSAALRQLVFYAFEMMDLRRLEAACLPNNKRSIHLLEKTGFQYEGLLRAYIQINGFWHDHLLFAILKTDIATLRSLP